MHLYAHKLGLFTWPPTYVWNMLIIFQINDDFLKVIMYYDVTSCVICISNEVEYLERLPKRLYCHFK